MVTTTTTAGKSERARAAGNRGRAGYVRSAFVRQAGRRVAARPRDLCRDRALELRARRSAVERATASRTAAAASAPDRGRAVRERRVRRVSARRGGGGDRARVPGRTRASARVTRALQLAVPLLLLPACAMPPLLGAALPRWAGSRRRRARATLLAGYEVVGARQLGRAARERTRGGGSARSRSRTSRSSARSAARGSRSPRLDRARVRAPPTGAAPRSRSLRARHAARISRVLGRGLEEGGAASPCGARAAGASRARGRAARSASPCVAPKRPARPRRRRSSRRPRVRRAKVRRRSSTTREERAARGRAPGELCVPRAPGRTDPIACPKSRCSRSRRACTHLRPRQPDHELADPREEALRTSAWAAMW